MIFDFSSVSVGEIPRNKSPLNVLNSTDSKNPCSFKKFLVEFITAVNPVSLYGLDKQDLNQVEILNQIASIEKALQRLCFPTMVMGWNEAGWKRMCRFIYGFFITSKTSKSGRQYFRLGAESYSSLRRIGKKKRK